MRRNGSSRKGVDAKKSTRILPAGWAFMTIILVALLAAWNTGNNLYYLVLAVLLSAYICALVFARLNLRRVGIVQSYPETVYQNDKFHVRTTFINKKRLLPAFLIETDVQVGATPRAKPFLFHAPPRQSDSVHVEAVTQHRGLVEVDCMAFRSRFPLGLFESTVVRESSCRLLVYPEIRRLHPSVLELVSCEGDVPAHRRGDSSDFYGIREYAIGDDSRLICWKISAKHNRLLLREFERHEHRGIVVWFDGVLTGDPDNGQLDMFEKAVSFCASLIWHYTSEGYEVGLVTPSAHVPPGCGRQHLHRHMELLALIDPVTPDLEKGSREKSVPRRVVQSYGQGRYVPVLVTPDRKRSNVFGLKSAAMRVVDVSELDI